MLSALLYLRLTSFKNWVRTRLQRLRQPKYVVGAVVGAAYFWFFFLRHIAQPNGASPGIPVRHGVSTVEMFPAAIILVQVIVVMAIARLIFAWLAPDKPGLPFTEAEIAFLFPAPISRRSLIHFKLLSSQLTILFSACLLTLLSNRWSALGGNAFTHAVGWWIIFSTINLHGMGASFTVARLVDRGVSRTQRRALVSTVIAGIVVAVGATIWFSLPPPTERELADPALLMRYLGHLSDTGVLHWVLAPVRLVAAPFFANNAREFLLALGPALAVLGLHYLWVLRGQTSFEEESIALAEKRARQVAERGENPRYHSPPKAKHGSFPLSPAGGRPEVAFLWKNLLSTRAFLNHRTFFIAIGIILVLHAWLSQGTPLQRAMLGGAAFISAIGGLYVLMLGPQFARQDLRTDLGNVDLLKTYPLRGWQVVLGELLTPIVILTGIIWLALLISALGLSGVRGSSPFLSPSFRATAAICLAAITPLVCCLQLMVPNAATLLFPSWAQTSRPRERGLDVVGQRLIFISGQLLVIVCALLPAVGLGILLWFTGYFFHLGPVKSALLATPGIILVLGLEIWVGLYWLGWRFERFDLSTESLK